MAIKTEYSVEEIFIDHISSNTIDVLVSDINPTYAALPFVVTSLGSYTEGPNFRGWNEGFLNYSLHVTLSGSGLVKCSGKEYVIKPGGVFLKTTGKESSSVLMETTGSSATSTVLEQAR